METLKVYEESPNTLVKMKKGPGRPKKSEAQSVATESITILHFEIDFFLIII
jgi:hypothetical protein